MAQGLDIPITSRSGRMKLIQGAAQITKLITLALGDGSSDNPFNTDVGIRDPVFKADTPEARAIYQRDVRRTFAALERTDRAKLEAIRFDPVDDNGDAHVTIHYRDLETDEDRDFTRRVS